MSVTTTVAPPTHLLIRRTDERGRVGSLHAAVSIDTTVPFSGYRTACGVEIHTAHSRIETWYGAIAFEILDAPGARHCARCVRVGDAVES